MEALRLSSQAIASFSIFAAKPNDFPAKIICFSKKNDTDSDIQSDPNNTSIVPLFGNQTFSQDAAMGLVLSAASVRGWTTGSGMEGPSIPARPDNHSNTDQICKRFVYSLS